MLLSKNKLAESSIIQVANKTTVSLNLGIISEVIFI